MKTLHDISQLVTPTPFPTSAATPAIQFGSSVDANQFAGEIVGGYNTINSTGIMDTMQIFLLVAVVIFGFFLIYGQVKNL